MFSTLAKILLAAVVVASLAGVASAVPIFNVDFNDTVFPAGNAALVPTAPPVAGGVSIRATDVRNVSGGMTYVSSSGHTDSVTGATMAGPAVVLKDTSTSAYGSITFVGAADDKASVGTAQLDFDMMLDSASTQAFTLSLFNSQMQLIGSFQFSPLNTSIVQQVYTAPGTFGSSRTLAQAGSFNLGQVHHVTVAMDLDAAGVEIFVDGASVGTGGLAAGGDFTGLRFGTGSTWVTTVAIDNVVTSVPEPATIGLLTTGICMLGARRRARQM